MVSRLSQKKFELNRSGETNQSVSLLFWIFYLLKVGLGAMFEVFPWASWRSNNGSKAFPKSSHTQILEILSWNLNFWESKEFLWLQCTLLFLQKMTLRSLTMKLQPNFLVGLGNFTFGFILKLNISHDKLKKIERFGFDLNFVWLL